MYFYTAKKTKICNPRQSVRPGRAIIKYSREVAGIITSLITSWGYYRDFRGNNAMVIFAKIGTREVILRVGLVLALTFRTASIKNKRAHWVKIKGPREFPGVSKICIPRVGVKVCPYPPTNCVCRSGAERRRRRDAESVGLPL